MEIKDKLLSPYSIKKTAHSYDVIEYTGTKDKKGFDVYKTYGHYTNVERALSKIVKLKTEVERTFSLDEYISRLESFNNTIFKLKSDEKA